jgi:predicted transcriptional regulator
MTKSPFFLHKEAKSSMKKRINITLEDEVIKRVDRYASELYTSRSGAITRLIVEATDSSGRPVVTEKE